MFKNIILAALLLSSISADARNQLEIIDKSKFTIGDRMTFNSTVLNENRILNVYLPSSYKGSPDKTYPVIYLLDGSAEEDFLHLAGLVQFGSFSWIQQIPESIVVGIENVDRKRDFTYPTNHPQDQKDFPTSGGSAKFIEFISSELQPIIEENYRTNANKTIIGQSLGGLLATEILFKAPELFDNYIIISPSLWWDDESLLAQPLKTSATEKLIYIGVGKEGDIMERTAKELFVKVNKQKPKHYSTYFKFFEQLSHGDTLHLAVYNAFDKLFRQ